VAGLGKAGRVVVQPDSTPSPVAESTVQFAIRDQRRLGAGLLCPDSSDGGASLPPTCNTGVGDLEERGGGSLWDGASLFDAGPDWLTGTSKHSPDAVMLGGRARELGLEFQDQGNEWIQDSKVLGYTGWACGPVYFGERDDSVIFRASSVAAGRALEVTRGLAFKATRVDLQLTSLFPTDRPDVGRLVADASDAAARELQGVATGSRRVWRTRRVDGYGHGDSAIIGSRASESFGRAYDKHRETLDKYRDSIGKFREQPGVYPLGSWRFETEYKGSQAQQVYQRLLKACDYRQSAVDHVKLWYTERGIPIPFEAADVPPVRTIKLRSDCDRMLDWLEEQVGPTVERLLRMGVPRYELYKRLRLLLDNPLVQEVRIGT